jgi:hypothetical protein
MNIEDQFSLEHLLFRERKCRSCGDVKDLIDGFYLTRKGRGAIPSAYSYECKICTISRIKSIRKNKKTLVEWEYPDW